MIKTSKFLTQQFSPTRMCTPAENCETGQNMLQILLLENIQKLKGIVDSTNHLLVSLKSISHSY